MKHSLTEHQILLAIEKAKKGIVEYLHIQSLLFQVDVSKDEIFQKSFNRFYKVRQRNKKWYETFYIYMEEIKQYDTINFSDTLLYFKNNLNRCEPSFSSKLIATLKTNMPIWDSYILENCNIKPPSYSDKNKCLKSIQKYQELILWYEDYLQTNEAKLILKLFDSNIISQGQISNTKKIDFVLWQVR